MDDLADVDDADHASEQLAEGSAGARGRSERSKPPPPARETGSAPGDPPPGHAEVVDAREYTVQAVCSAVHMTPAMLRRYRLAGIVAPVRTTAHGARYDEAAVVRLRTTRRLMRDLGTNLAGAQVALHLLDQLAEARREIALLQAQLADLQTRRATDSP